MGQGGPYSTRTLPYQDHGRGRGLLTLALRDEARLLEQAGIDGSAGDLVRVIGLGSR